MGLSIFVVLAVLLIVYGQNCECQAQNNCGGCGDSIQNNGQNNQNNVNADVFNQVNESPCNQPCYESCGESRRCNEPPPCNQKKDTGGFLGESLRGMGISTC